MPWKAKNNARQGFTLLELLIVIGVLAILSAVVTLVLNPVEQLKKARDARRISDLSTINRALGYFESEKGGTLMGNPNTIYISLPDTSSVCANLSLPTPPPSWSYSCATSQNLRNVDGTGWIPVNFKSASFGSPFAALPIDPQNNTTYYYTYVTGGSWALSALLESQKQLQEQAAKDGGYDPGKAEVGTDLSLVAKSEGLVGWWPFNEGTGNETADARGNNTGTLLGGVTWVDGQVGKALSFDGVGGRVVTAQNVGITGSSARTLEFWAKVITNPADRSVIGWGTGGTYLSFAVSLYGASYPGPWYFWGQAYDLSFGVMPTLGVWQHIVVTFDGTTVRDYINGAEVANGALPLLNTPDSPLYVGRFIPGWMAYANVVIDEVRVYNRTLSAAEIKAIYDATK